ncbi:sll0787 family AIR synthase-like protein [Desulfosporosinus sp. Sb-LF]|uniref:sll0787 family AIR synthase-like protein n=1 Tax=Desulfosporosinus sp. Sb-LF TaxID=2560027 RepID=UPI00107F6922|nr:sll0787 family AIR synthase-like protein [Desulfosporosinus sp. Sb-LF]TGE31502.1 sll0787 family AIR synthase-like protein [Desulfosporosinus sp. Sb-LF]
MSWLNDLVENWLATGALHQKQDIQTVSNSLPLNPLVDGQPVLLGDDAAAITVDGGYLLLAAEGVWPPLLRANPKLAGRCCVLTNVSDIYAMGGRPTAVVDVLFASDDELASQVLSGMQENAERFGVPIVGGHYTKNRDTSALAVAILGQAKRLLTSHTARPGDQLMLVCKLEGRLHDTFDFWDCSSMCSPEQLRSDLELLPLIAETGLCDTAKDVSMAGILGTTIMLLETSGYGARVSLDEIPCPLGVNIERWLRAFPSYGFILSVRPQQVNNVRLIFEERGLCCASYATVLEGPAVTVHGRGESKVIWDLKTPLMGFVQS